MRAVVIDDGLRLDESAPMPQPKEGEVLIRLLCAGICNTDLELMQGYLAFSGVLGHEFVGVVEKGAPEWVGKRIVSEINVGCGHCDFCLAGIRSHCRTRQSVGIFHYDGAFADYMRLPAANLHVVPDEVTNDQAVFVEPLAAVLQILSAVQVSAEDRIVVLGAGKLGLLAAQVVNLTGADVSVVVRRQKQSDLLNRWGIRGVAYDALEPQRATIVIDCTGQPAGFADALNLVQPRGTIVLKSTYTGIPQADLTQVAVNEIRVIGSRCGPFAPALRLLAAGRIDVTSMIESRYGLDRAIEAFEAAAQPGMLKVLLDIQASGSVM